MNWEKMFAVIGAFNTRHALIYVSLYRETADAIALSAYMCGDYRDVYVCEVVAKVKRTGADGVVAHQVVEVSP